MGLEIPASCKAINRNTCRYWCCYVVRAVRYFLLSHFPEKE
jgi:hypothetical protein